MVGLGKPKPIADYEAERVYHEITGLALKEGDETAPCLSHWPHGRRIKMRADVAETHSPDVLAGK